MTLPEPLRSASYHAHGSCARIRIVMPSRAHRAWMPRHRSDQQGQPIRPMASGHARRQINIPSHVESSAAGLPRCP
eukprot:4533868-Prymnesium_polylepis.3